MTLTPASPATDCFGSVVSLLSSQTPRAALVPASGHFNQPVVGSGCAKEWLVVEEACSPLNPHQHLHQPPGCPKDAYLQCR